MVTFWRSSNFVDFSFSWAGFFSFTMLICSMKRSSLQWFHVFILGLGPDLFERYLFSDLVFIFIYFCILKLYVLSVLFFCCEIDMQTAKPSNLQTPMCLTHKEWGWNTSREGGGIRCRVCWWVVNTFFCPLYCWPVEHLLKRMLVRKKLHVRFMSVCALPMHASPCK